MSTRKSWLEFEYGIKNENKILHPVRFIGRRVWRNRLRRLLRWLSRIQWLLWPPAVLRRGLSGDCCRGSALLPRCWILVRPDVLRLEAWPLGVVAWPESLEARPLRCTRILIR